MKNPNDEIEKMLTLDEASKMLGGVSIKTMRRYIDKGRKTNGKDGIWPVYRMPGKLLIRMSTLETYLEMHRAI